MNKQPLLLKWSLKQRLLALVLGAVGLVWSIAAVFTYFDARHEFNEVLDAHLAQSATLLVAQSAEEVDDIETEHAPLLHKYSRHIAFQVWEDGELRLHSENAPSIPLGTETAGFSDHTIAGQPWRVFSLASQHQNEYPTREDEEVIIHVAELMAVRNELAAHIISHLLLPLFITLPLLGALIWLAVQASLEPLVRLTQAIARRQAHTLTDLTVTAPSEVQPLIAKLNQLFAKIRALIDNERRFTADAAHELRTPIAAIKAQIQVAQGAHERSEQAHALKQALQGCQRATHLIEQLLTMARLESTANAQLERCDLRGIASQVIADLAPTALAKGINLELVEGEEVHVQGLPTLLAVSLRNLVDNAIRHTQPATQVMVSTGREAITQTPFIRVCDTGQGLPANELERITQRFYRPVDTHGHGSGLGLSIVTRIAEIHGASLQIQPAAEATGLCVTLVFKASVE